MSVPTERWQEERIKFMEIAQFLAQLQDTQGRPVCSYDEAHDLLGPLALRIGFVEWARTPEEYERYRRGRFNFPGMMEQAEREAESMVASMTPEKIQEMAKRFARPTNWLPSNEDAGKEWVDP